MKSWFLIDGSLEQIGFQGLHHFRLPEELVEIVIEHFSSSGDWILDPFCGFGSTISVAQRMGRQAIGFEMEKDRAEFAQEKIFPPNQVINDVAEHISSYNLPQFDLLFTSPPFYSFRTSEEIGFVRYYQDLLRIFSELKTALKAHARVIIEVSNVKRQNKVYTLAWNVVETLSQLFIFEGEIVRCNTGPLQAGPGFEHSYLMVFRLSNANC